MSRLVQGDVGSGKTVIAFLAMVLSAENGFQSALMVPTEVLANQHYEGFLRLMEEQNIASCHPVLLTGSTTARQKREIYQKIADGEVNVIIGTHALIQEKVEYKNLGLVITDEQHRFGVRQREALTTRGNPPHVLVMSATPIPPDTGDHFIRRPGYFDHRRASCKKTSDQELRSRNFLPSQGVFFY